jgi:phospholipid/cholesterol/gamma-HCH transport system permease protein
MKGLAGVGASALDRVAGIRYLAAVVAAVLRSALQPANWTAPVRDVLARQIYFTGIQAVHFTLEVGLLVGVSIVVQVQLWLTRVGQSNLLGPILVTVVIRELGPLAANLIVIGRSGNAVAAELGGMAYRGEVRVLDAMGLDPMIYLVLPRALGMAISVFCLTVVFIAGSLISGYLCGYLFGVRVGPPGLFVTSLAGALGLADVFNLLVKSLASGLLAGTICCVAGLSVGNDANQIPRACTQAVQGSILALFLVSAVASLMTYL